jgi:hypothetical protein
MVTRLVLASLVAVGAASQQPPAQPPPAPTNLQVLPKDSSRRDVVAVMRTFALGLGVRCQHCHVYKGDDPNDLSTFDFASDEKTPKATARTMMRMTYAINAEHLKGIGEPAKPGASKVTCYTCHRGDKLPASQAPLPPRPTPSPGE